MLLTDGCNVSWAHLIKSVRMMHNRSFQLFSNVFVMYKHAEPFLAQFWKNQSEISTNQSPKPKKRPKTSPKSPRKPKNCIFIPIIWFHASAQSNNQWVFHFWVVFWLQTPPNMHDNILFWCRTWEDFCEQRLKILIGLKNIRVPHRFKRWYYSQERDNQEMSLYCISNSGGLNSQLTDIGWHPSWHEMLSTRAVLADPNKKNDVNILDFGYFWRIEIPYIVEKLEFAIKRVHILCSHRLASNHIDNHQNYLDPFDFTDPPSN
jgi:hypothetical protein